MDKVNKLLLDIQGQEEIDELTAKIKLQEDELKQLAAIWRQTGGDMAQFQAIAAPMAQNMQTMQNRLSMLIGTAGRGGGAGQGLLGLSYGLQDIITVLSYGGGWQRAMMSATNNISPVVAAIGGAGAAGLAGGIGLAVTAMTAALPKIQEFFAGLGKAGGPVAELNEQIKGLKARMDEIKAKGEEAGKPKRAGVEEESIESMTEFFRDIPGLTRSLTAAMREAKVGAPITRQEEQQLAMARGFIEAGERTGAAPVEMQRRRARLAEVQAAINQRLDKDTTEMAKGLLGRAILTEGGREQLAAVAGAAPRFFPRGFVPQMRELTPEALRASQAAEDEYIAEGDRAKEMGKARRHQIKQDKDLDAWLNRDDAALARQAREERIRAAREVGPGPDEWARELSRRHREAAQGAKEAGRDAERQAREQERAVEQARRFDEGRKGLSRANLQAAGGIQNVLNRQAALQEQGVFMRLPEIAERMADAQRERQKLMGDFVDANVEAANGMAQENAVLRRGIRRLNRAADQNVAPGRDAGHP